LGAIRGYVLDHEAMAQAASRGAAGELRPDGGNLAAVLEQLSLAAPAAFASLASELVRLMPEFQGLQFTPAGERVEFGLRLVEGEVVPAAELSQGTLYLVAILALTFNPAPPRVLCLEEVDRGIHPRMLREIRDALYRLSHPPVSASDRRPVQIITTTHSPYFIDLFRDHPEEVIISQKVGRAARFERLIDRPDLPELLQEGSLGDMWFSGILGGTPEGR
jgi:predicted ATPase